MRISTVKLHVRYLVQTCQSIAIRTNSAHTDAYLSGSLHQLVRKTDIANTASGQQEVHFTRPKISMLRKWDLTYTKELQEISGVHFSTAQINPFAVKILCPLSTYLTSPIIFTSSRPYQSGSYTSWRDSVSFFEASCIPEIRQTEEHITANYKKRLLNILILTHMYPLYYSLWHVENIVFKSWNKTFIFTQLPQVNKKCPSQKD